MCPRGRDTGIAIFEQLSRQAMTFLVDHVGPYPYEKLANLQAAGLSGGTEHASAIFYGEKGGDRRARAGGARNCLPVATYFTLLFTEHAEGRDAFVEGLKRSRDAVIRTEQKLSDTPVIHLASTRCSPSGRWPSAACACWRRSVDGTSIMPAGHRWSRPRRHRRVQGPVDVAAHRQHR